MTSLEDQIAEATARDGLHELIVRVSQYGGALLNEPQKHQAIAKYHGRITGPWGVGIADTPTEAIRLALDEGAKKGRAVTSAPAETEDEDIFG